MTARQDEAGCVDDYVAALIMNYVADDVRPSRFKDGSLGISADVIDDIRNKLTWADADEILGRVIGDQLLDALGAIALDRDDAEEGVKCWFVRRESDES